MPHDVLWHVGREPAIALPHDEMRGIGGVHHVHDADVTGVLLPDALEDALGARPLDADCDPRKLYLKGLGNDFGDLQVD